MSKDPRLQGMDVRYGGRTLQAKIGCGPGPATQEREKFDALAQRVKTAARGPGLRMAVVSGSMTDSGAYLEIVVNTDESGQVLHDRLMAALKREGIDAFGIIEEWDPVGAAMFWHKLFGAAEATVEQERKRS
jgi:hypothetical protein